MTINNNKVAIFDVDGTLIDIQSQQLFLKYMRQRGLIPWIAYIRILTWFILYKAGIAKDPKEIMNYAFSFLRGMSEDELKNLIHDFFNKHLKSHIFDEAIASIKSHKKQGHRVVLVSNAVEYIVKEIGKYLGVGNGFCLATKLQKRKGMFTGSISGDMMYASNKVNALKKFFSKKKIQPEETWAYSDHESDIDVLEYSNHPCAVNPDHELSQFAKKKGWPIVRFKCHK